MIQITPYTFTTANTLTTEQSINYNNQVDQFNVWPAYVLADKMNLTYWDTIHELFADYQFYLLEDDVVVGNGNCIPLHLSEAELANLSDRGWDWALEKSVLDYEKGLKPNTLCALQIGLNKDFQGKGISSHLISYMKSIALKMNLNAFILPIRPNLKTNFPLIPMEEYIQWTNKEGLPYDAWVRTHVKGGAKIVKVCSESMIIEGTVKEWESWTGLTFQSSGEYLLPVLLNPITIDLVNDRGVYIEPNVWMQYDINS